MLQQLNRRLLPHPWHTGDVIRRIAFEALEVKKLANPNTIALLKGSDVEFVDIGQAFFEGIEVGILVEYLQGVEVARDEIRLYIPLLLSLGIERRHNIVCLIIIKLIQRPTKRLQKLVE